MAGYVPGQQPANRSQEKEFVQAYEDVLERYKGAAGAGAGGSLGTGVRGRAGAAWPSKSAAGGAAGRGRAHPSAGAGPERCFSGPAYLQNPDEDLEPSSTVDGAFYSASYIICFLSGPAGRRRDQELAVEPSCCGELPGSRSGAGEKPPLLPPVRVFLAESRTSACPQRVPRPLLSPSVAHQSPAWQLGP